MSKKLDSYKGELTSEKIAEGMNAAISNAKRLCEDAIILLNAGRFPSACSLAILSIEESGKSSILRRIALAKDSNELSGCWKDFRSHTKKNFSWILPDLVSKGARRLGDFRVLFDKDSEHTHLLDQVKQICFYTDCLGNAHWSVPENVIDEDLAKLIVTIAQIFSNDKKVTTEEIDLWIKHLKPVWMKDDNSMKEALISFYDEMKDCGLIPSSEVNQMERFINSGL